MRLPAKEKWLWLVPLIAVLLLWEFIAGYVIRDPLTLPRFSTVIFSIYILRELVIPDILTSLLHFGIGLALAFAVALPLAIGMGWFRNVFKAIDPIIEILRPIPPLAWIPVAILWIGLTHSAAGFIIFIGAFFPILIDSYTGFRDVPKILLETGKVLGCIGNKKLIKYVAFPYALPSIATGTRVGMGVGWMCVVAGKEFSKVVAAELKKRRLIPLCADNAKLPYLVKIFGYLLGEGTVYDKNVFFYGDRENLEEIKGDIRVLGYTGGIYERQRMHSLKGYEFCRKETCLKVSARSLAELLFALGYPRGKKTETDLHVPEWLLRLPKWMKRLFLATYFGAEMSKSKSSNGYNFCMPEVKRSKSKGKKRGSDEFLNELQEMLTELGVSSTVSIAEETGDRRVYRLLVKANPDNFIRLLSRVGYEYNRKRRQFAMAAIVYTRLKIAAIRERERLRAEIRTFRGKKRINELEEIYRERLNRRFIERSLYEETTGARPPFGFIKYEEFLQNFSDGEVVYDKIVEMGEYKFNERVYDFTVKDKSHNFVADCFVVSNCGVRLIRTNLMEEDVRPHLSEILDGLFEYIPAGLGLSGKERLSYSQLDEVLRGGTEWCIENGYGWEEDIERTEEGGRLEAANPEKIDEKSKKRGVPQLGTLGSGNHFLEVGVVDDIFDVPLAKAYGIDEKGQVIVLIHTGGRGFSHGVCTYYLRNFEREMSKNATLSQILGLERQLACAYLSSDTGMDYFEAMCACANYAFANRQLATHWVRKVFEDVLRSSAEDMEIKLVYDIAHNIAKEEEHVVNGKRKKLCVHRKGATRAFPADDKRLPPFYRNIGQPVLIPGSMGTRSFLAVGTEVAKEETFGSCAHGSGREMSRTAAMKKYRGIEVKEELAKRNIIVKTRERTKRDVRKKKGIPFDKYGELAEEVAAAYKDPEVVIRSCEVSGIAKRVAAVRGIGVIKG